MRRYVSRCNVMMNGTTLQDVKNFKFAEEIARKRVDLMNSTGSTEVTPRFEFSLDYVLPKDGKAIKWLDIEGATIIVELNGGKRVSYSGVDCLSQGEQTVDGENESVRTISFVAARKSED